MRKIPKKLTDEIVEKIRRLRDEECLSQIVLAERFGVSRFTIRDILNDRKRFSK